MKDNNSSDPINRLFRVAKEAPANIEDADQFGPEADSDALKKVKGGILDANVGDSACFAAPGSIMATHTEL